MSNDRDNLRGVGEKDIPNLVTYDVDNGNSTADQESLPTTTSVLDKNRSFFGNPSAVKSDTIRDPTLEMNEAESTAVVGSPVNMEAKEKEVHADETLAGENGEESTQAVSPTEVVDTEKLPLDNTSDSPEPVDETFEKKVVSMDTSAGENNQEETGSTVHNDSNGGSNEKIEDNGSVAAKKPTEDVSNGASASTESAEATPARGARSRRSGASSTPVTPASRNEDDFEKMMNLQYSGTEAAGERKQAEKEALIEKVKEEMKEGLINYRKHMEALTNKFDSLSARHLRQLIDFNAAPKGAEEILLNSEKICKLLKKQNEEFNRMMGELHRLPMKREAIGKNIFSKKVFMLTSANRSSNSNVPSMFKKKNLKAFIIENGGIVIEKHSSFQEHQDREPMLISDTYNRTHKYLTALAQGIPCVSNMWLQECGEKGECVDHTGFILPAGPSIFGKYAVGKNIFSKKVFMLISTNRSSNSNDPSLFKKKNLMDFIIQNGGIVTEQHSSFQEHQDREPMLISDTFYRTPKYLAALARGIPCVSIMWLQECGEKGECVDHIGYILPAGASIFNKYETMPPPKIPGELLNGKTIYIHSMQTTKTGPGSTFIKIWKPILELLGATVIEGDYDKVIGNGAKFDVALVDGTFRDEVLSYADKIGASKVTSEWVIQTIILGEAPEPTAHPKFDPNRLHHRTRYD